MIVVIGNGFGGALVLIEEVVKIFGDDCGIPAGCQAIFVVVAVIGNVSHRRRVEIVPYIIIIISSSSVDKIDVVVVVGRSISTTIRSSLTDNGQGLTAAHLADHHHLLVVVVVVVVILTMMLIRILLMLMLVLIRR